MKNITYLIYILTLEVMIFGGTGYAVFILNRSGWWFLLAIFISAHTMSKKQWMRKSRNMPKKSSEEKTEEAEEESA